MTEKVQNTARDMRRMMRVLLVATVILYLGGIGLGLYTLSVANNNQEALCSLRNNYIAQNVSSQELLNDNPNKSIGGFSPKQIKQRIKDRNKIILALDNHDCKPPLKEILNGPN